MNKELDKKLCKKYPKIFADRNGDRMETCMCWGFECGDGWYNIIDKLCSNLQWDTDNNNSGPFNKGTYPQVVASQVKEKFGGLCFYVQSATGEQYAVIHFVESLSHDICEECGSIKNVGRTEGWIYTRCIECVAKDPERYTGWEQNKT